MSTFKAAEEISEIHPLALDVWTPIHDGMSIDSTGRQTPDKLSSYMMNLVTVDEQIPILHGEARRALAHNSLLATVAAHADRNNHGPIVAELPDEFIPAVYGNGSPAEMVNLLHTFPDVLHAVEIARKTHIGQWDVREIIDLPVRQSLKSVPSTVEVEDEPRYKPKHFDAAGVMVERKRIVRSHYNGKLLTIIRNCMLVDYNSPAIPSDLYDYALNEQDDALSSNESESSYDYSRESPAFKDYIEPYITRKNTAPKLEKPDWIIPLLTTYYTTYADLTKRSATRRVEE